MTRINTNVGSLVGRNNLVRANASLSQSLTRLSTGLRINTGADDPAGLIASENLRSDITSIQSAISNTDRASQVIATADSSLGQVSSLLNDIRGLVTESANSGALSDEQIAANQLQVDSSLEALNRIAQTTTFQGRRLLDGSLDFLTSPSTNAANLSNLKIDQANLGATGQTSVDVNVETAATQASIEVGNLPDVSPTSQATIDLEVETTAAVAATGEATFSPITTDATQGEGDITLTAQATGTLTLDTSGETLTVTSVAGGNASGDANINIALTDGNGTPGGVASAAYNTGTDTIEITADFASGTLTLQELQDAINGINAGADFVATGGSATNLNAADDGTYNNALTGGGSATLTLDAVADSNADGDALVNNTNPAIAFTNTASADSATYDPATGANGTLTINISTGDTTQRSFRDIAQLIQDSGSFTVNGGVAAVSNSLNAGTNAAEVNAVTSDVITVGAADGGAAAIQAEDFTLTITGTTAAGEDGNVALNFEKATLGNNSTTTRVIGNKDDGYTVQINSEHVGGVTVAELRSAVESITEIDTAVIKAGSIGTDATILDQFTAFGVDELTSADVTLANGVTAIKETASLTVTTAVGFTGNLDLNFSEVNLSTTPVNAGTGTTVGDLTTYNVELNNNATFTLQQLADGLSSQIAEIGSVAISGLSTSQTVDLTTSGQDAAPSGTTSIVGAGAGTSTKGLDDDLVFELAGATGSEVLTFEAGTSLALVIAGVEALKDATGVTAKENATKDGVIFESTEYGSDAFVDINVIEEGTNGDFVANLTNLGTAQSVRVTGADIVANINGITATGNGNNISINTATLDLSATIAADFTGTIEFDITGGGALFQLGPDVVSNQQARLGISSVNTAALGGSSGLLYQLGTGGTADLTSDPTAAASIVEEAINQVTSLRGRLGAFQRTTLETNKNALNDTLANLTEAESSIRDADFAAETAQLTRSQILVQSGTRVLAIANQNPQNVLGLLG